jgi:hypothetical protein
MPGDGLVDIEVRPDGSIRVDRVPAAHAQGILRLILGKPTTMDADIRPDPARLLDVVKTWDAESLHERNEILDAILPGWNELDEAQRNSLKAWLSSQLIKTGFHKDLKKAGLQLFSKRQPNDGRSLLYGVRHAQP